MHPLAHYSNLKKACTLIFKRICNTVNLFLVRTALGNDTLQLPMTNDCTMTLYTFRRTIYAQPKLLYPLARHSHEIQINKNTSAKYIRIKNEGKHQYKIVHQNRAFNLHSNFLLIFDTCQTHQHLYDYNLQWP